MKVAGFIKSGEIKMKKYSILLSMLLLLIVQQASAQGDLLISPVRVIFDGNKQRQDISLVNIGNDTAVYSVSFVQYDMNEKGNFILVEKPVEGGLYADKYIRVFPRRIVLAPHGSQVVRLQLRRAPGMATGEYRSHLYFRAEKSSKPQKLGMVDKSKLMSVDITPVFGISIPVILRVGDVKATSALSDLNLSVNNDTTAILHMSINRSGNMSLYGDIVVDYIPPKGKPVEIGNVRGVAVYTSTDKRLFTVKLKDIAALKSKEGRLRVLFTSPKDSKYEVYAEKDLDL